jgi:hypothetical protein
MDRASYEAGFRAAQEQNLQQPPEQGNQFLDAVGKTIDVVGKTALGLGVAAGAGIAGRRLMRGRGDQVRQNAEQVAKYVMARDPQKSGVNVRDLSKIDPDAVRRAAAYGKTLEAEYVAPGRIDAQDFASPKVQESRRQQATQDLLAAQQARKGAYQLEIPGVKGDLMVIRSKEGFDPQVTGEATPSAPSRPLSAAPDQLSIDFSKKYLSDKGYIDPGTSTEAQVVRRSSVVEQSNEALDTAADQEAMRVSRTVQRDPNENLAEFERVQDGLEQRGASPVEAANAAVSVTEDVPAFTQTDRPTNPNSWMDRPSEYDLQLRGLNQQGVAPASKAKPAGDVITGALTPEQEFQVKRSLTVDDPAYRPLVDPDEFLDSQAKEAQRYLRAKEIDTDFDYSRENAAQLEQVKDRIARAKALQTEGNRILDEIRGESSAGIPSALSGFEEVDNVRQRVELRTPEDQRRAYETIEGVMTGNAPEVGFNLQGRALRGGEVDAAGDVRFSGEGGELTDASTGVRIGQYRDVDYNDQQDKLLAMARRGKTKDKFYRFTDQDLEQTVNRVQKIDPSKRTGADLDELRGANNELNRRFDKTDEPSREQLSARERRLASIDASRKVLAEQRQSQQPFRATGPEADVSRSMKTYRTALDVPSSQDPDVARVASLVEGPYYEQQSPGDSSILSTSLGVAGAPRSQAVARQVEDKAQSFLSDAISGGLTVKATPGVEAPSSPIRTRPVTYVESQGPKLFMGEGLGGPDLSQLTGYARYIPGRDAPAPVSPFIGEMSGGTRYATPVGAPASGRDVGRMPGLGSNLSRSQTNFKNFRPASSALTDDVLMQAAPYGPVNPSLLRDQERARRTQDLTPASIGPAIPSRGETRISAYVADRVQDASGKPITRLTGLGKTSQYPRMSTQRYAEGLDPATGKKGYSVPNVPTRAAWKLDPDRPMILPNEATGEVQTVYMGGGPLRRYQM